MTDNTIVGLQKIKSGWLGIDLRNINTGRMEQFIWRHDEDMIFVSMAVAVSIFTVPATKRMFNEGKFIINKQNEEAVYNAARELGLYSGTTRDGVQATEVLSDKDCEQILLQGKLLAIDKIFENPKSIDAEKLLGMAVSMKSHLSGRTINAIEKHTKTSLGIDGYIGEEEEF